MFSAFKSRLKTLAAVSPAIVAFHDWVCGQALVCGASMQPTFNPECSSREDRVLIDRWSIKMLHRYERGQVVLLR